MDVLVDTNLLTKIVDPTNSQHAVALAAIAKLHKQNASIHIVPQVLYEFWVVGTRSLAQNGLGMSIAEAESARRVVKYSFHLLHDIPRLYFEWEQLVVAHAVIGKPAHDARLVAAMNVHGLTHLLTFNRRDFTRYPGIVILDPQVVAASVP